MEDENLSIEFERRAFDFRFHRDGYVFDLRTLADGHAAVLGILAELLIRVEMSQREHKDATFEPEGVVIIDEVEAHLHLSLQEQILPFLTELFPRFQFIVATHSPAVIASIKNAVVYDLKTRDASLSDSYQGIRYGTLMTEHFGISSEIDLDTTAKLVRLRELSRQATRTPEEEHEVAHLSTELLARSPSMAVEIWAIKEGLGELRAAGGARG
jgi:predicted ATP-binding protein involved in virulence